MSEVPIGTGYDFNHKLTKYNYIGKGGIGRKDGYNLASGKAQFTKDMQFPHMLYAKTYRSPYAAAKIKSMDTSKAEAVPGVKLVIRYDDPNPQWLAWYNPSAMPTIPGGFQAILGDRACHGDQPVGAVVIAESTSICDEALSLITVEWEQLPWFTDGEEAAKPSAPILFPEISPKTNVIASYPDPLSRGDAESAFAQADHIIEFSIRRWDNGCGPVEGAAVLTKWQGDEAEAWLASQFPHQSQEAAAIDVYNLASNKYHLFSPSHGGSFGATFHNFYNTLIGPLGAILSKRVGQPVQFTMDTTPYIRDVIVSDFKFKVGYKNTGEITGIEQSGFSPVGSVVSLEKTIADTSIPYVRDLVTLVYTNKACWTTQRDGAGPCSWMNIPFMRVAEELGMDPTKVALLNNGANGSKKNLEDLATERLKPGVDSLKQCITAGKEAFGWDGKWHAPGKKQLSNGRMHGVSFAWCEEWAMWANFTQIMASIDSDGKVLLSGRRGDSGQDTVSCYARIFADETGIKYEDISCDFHHNCNSSVELKAPGGSGGLVNNGSAVVDAAHKIRNILFEMATSTGEFANTYPTASYGEVGTTAIFPGLTANDLDLKDSVVFEKAKPKNSQTIQQIISAFEGTIHANRRGGATVIGSAPGLANAEHPTRQCHFMEVEVDTDTGKVYITKLVNVNDVGKAINPDALNGQQYGGSYMGVGLSNQDRIIYDPTTGIMLNNNLIEYKWPAFQDIGASMQQILIETEMGHGIYGATGIGENVGACTCMLTYMAIHNATGVWVDQLPSTPDVVLKALGKA